MTDEITLQTLHDTVTALSRRVDALERRATPAPRHDRSTHRSSAPRPRQITSKYGGRCASCGSYYDEGEPVWWCRDDNGKSVCWHAACDNPL